MELSKINSINNEKSLCLYCDKLFSSNADQENHVERDHKANLSRGKGSRKSERITKNNSTLENSSFPGCFLCNNKTLRTDDLDTLFQHLLTVHKGVYFGCKCRIRTQDKVSLAKHKKNCKKIDGGKSVSSLAENITEHRKTKKKSQNIKINGGSKCDSLSNENTSNAAAVNNSKTLPTNVIHKKSDRNRLKIHSKIASGNDKIRKSKSSSSSTISSSSSNKTGDDEYIIPLTRQKLKEPAIAIKSSVTYSRPPNTKKSPKNKTLVALDTKNIAPSPTIKVHRSKTSKILSATISNISEALESAQKIEPVSTDFDEGFYKNISDNIRLNLNCYVDGKSDSLLNRPTFDKLSEQSIKCSGENQALIPFHEKEIHEATNFELSTPFPALLTVEQYGFGDSNPNKNKRQITKNSWKWKWDLIKKYKYVNEGGKIVKKVKQITNGLKDLSQLDMWTQLSMRSRYECLNWQNEITSHSDDGLNESLSTRMIKTQNINQLNHILDKCLTPEIHIEQLQQTVIKVEPEEKEKNCETYDFKDDNDEIDNQPELLSMFNLVRTKTPNLSKPLLSGEWARPRCYICLDCGQKFDLMKSLNDHKNSEHAYVVSAHYEIVGRENLEHKLYKNLFLPKKALQICGLAQSLSVNNDSKSNETNEASTSSDNSSKFFVDQKEKECSKCLKLIKYSSDNDIYRHILDCVEDRVWLQAKRRSKYRRSRRKSRKTPRRSRLSVDQKKIASSPSTKDTTEGEYSISNPPTPKNDSNVGKPVIIKAINPQHKPSNGKINASKDMSIKNFFRVSKTTSFPQKVAVQMLETSKDHVAPLKSFLRSSTAKIIQSDDSKNDSVVRNDNRSLESEKKENFSASKISNSVERKPEKILKPFIPLLISTHEKNTSDLQLNSPSHLSVISPTSSSNVPKKKKKLNDCIAMLTCKIQEKLGVNFFENPEIVPQTETSNETPSVEKHHEHESENEIVSKSIHMDSALKPIEFIPTMQDEVIDLSIKNRIATCCEESNLEIYQNIPLPQVNQSLGPFKELETKTEFVSVSTNFETEETCEIKQIIVLDSPLNNNNAQAIEEQSDLVCQPLANKTEATTITQPELNRGADEFYSLKVSIPKNKIPNLKKILNQCQVITVNNITISESERRAFEEQKDRILKILNKTNSLTRKIASRKVRAKKVVKKTQQKKKAMIPSEATVIIDPHANGNTRLEIDRVIKTTNRIRCRRLSVVVDPIANLSTYQNKNRKIRLTNNSQQNGFCDLLAASEQFFSDNNKNTNPKELSEYDESKAEKIRFELENEHITKITEANNLKFVKELSKISTPLESARSEKPKTKILQKNFTKRTAVLKTVQVVPTKVKHETDQESKSQSRVENSENISSPVVVLEPLENVCFGNEEIIQDLTSETTRIRQKYSANEDLSPEEEIKVEQSVESTRDHVDKKKKTIPKAEENDSTNSSDTSNENDIPLAKLLSPTADSQFVKIESPVVYENIDKSDNQILTKEKVGKTSKLKTTAQSLELPSKNKKKPFDFKEASNAIESSKTPITGNDSDEIKDISTESILKVSEKKNYVPLNLNEDSFFNDDLDNDPSDKINDIINNIINSSEFQIGTDLEKGELNQERIKNQTSPCCIICKRTFRNQKVYDKHCTTTTHIMKVERKSRGTFKPKDKEHIEVGNERVLGPILDEAKVIRTKGALKIFDNVTTEEKQLKIVKCEQILQNTLKNDLTQNTSSHTNDDKLYYEFKMEKKPEDMTSKDKDQLFDSLFNSLEAKAQESNALLMPKRNHTSIDSEIETSSTSWNLKNDAEWDGDNVDNVPFANAIEEKFPKKYSVKINKFKDTAVSIPTKSLIMGKIFKKHRDREKQKTPQADAPNNKPGIKNSLDEIFDHLKNSAEIDDKVLTCPSPKTLLRCSGGAFSSSLANPNDLIETASQSNNNNYENKQKEVVEEKIARVLPTKPKSKGSVENHSIESIVKVGDDGLGKRKSRRRCAIKAKTFAETWSSDEYEELHDTADIISIINEIEMRESNKKRKIIKPDNHFEVVKKSEVSSSESIMKNSLAVNRLAKHSETFSENTTYDKMEKKRSVQIHFIDRITNSTKKRKISTFKDGHKSDEETFRTKTNSKPTKPELSNAIKKRRMSCFIPSTVSLNDRPKFNMKQAKDIAITDSANSNKMEKSSENSDIKTNFACVRKTDSEKSFKNAKNYVDNLCFEQSKKKFHKHRKRPRNRVKNIAYDSDSDFELNLNRKSKASAFSENSSSEDAAEDNLERVSINQKIKKPQNLKGTSKISSTNDMTMKKELLLLPNDLKQTVSSISINKAAITEDIATSQSTCNRTKRQSSEKLYYWSSSSSEGDQEQGDTADGDNEDSLVPHQPEQHGWIVGDSHKKLVTLLAHAKIKNKIN